jgi:hypothetical protein
MSRLSLGLVAATCTLALAPLAHAGDFTPVDMSAYVNQGFARPGSWFANGASAQFTLPGVSTGNLGSTIPFNIASTPDGNGFALNYWYGLDDATNSDNLFNGPPNSVTIASPISGGNVVHILADNTFGRFDATEFSVTFHGAGGDLTGLFVGGYNTKDYFTPNCVSTGCSTPPAATDWFTDGVIVLQDTAWYLPTGFGLTSMTFDQIDAVDGAILWGVSVGSVPEPATWALMIGGFGLMGARLRRRRVLAPV